MSKLPALFKKRTPNEVSVIAVPDIKEYLVREYERVEELRRENERLREQIEQYRELQMKYDAALVTLDEYSKRQEIAKIELQREKDRTAAARQEADKYRDTVNTYKIQFNNAAITREQIKDEVIAEVKNDIIERIIQFKGNLSKAAAREIVLYERGS